MSMSMFLQLAGNELTARKVFSVMALINISGDFCYVFPTAVQGKQAR
jgi:hypothetical protein